MIRLLLAPCLLLASSAFGQTAEQEARLAAATATMEDRNRTYYATIDPRFVPMLAAPPVEDPAFAKNRSCFLERLADSGGADVLARYIAAAEYMAGLEIVSLIDLMERIPDDMMTDLVFEASEACGPMSYTIQQLASPEFTAIMDEPEVLRRLMGK